MGRVAQILITASMQDVYDKIRTVDQSVNRVIQKIEDSRLKLTVYWSYANQMMSLFLNQMQARAQTEEELAHVSTITSYMQVVQTEVAIAQTISQAMAAGTAQRYGQAAMFWSIAIGMQANLALARRAKREAEAAKREVEAYNRGIYAYVQRYG